MYALKYFFYSSIYIKIIIIGMVFFLILVFAMGINKIKKLNYINSYINEFETQFWSGIDLTQFYQSNKDNLNHPLGMIFKAVFEEWQASESLRGQISARQNIKERMINVANMQKIKVMQTCEQYLDTLSLFIHISPFIGLIGTIIGIIDVFYNIDLQNGLNLPTVSIGIGGSLICILLSVIVVCISMVLFWFFNLKLQKIMDEMDSFIVDYVHILCRGLDGISTTNEQSQTQEQQKASQKVENKVNDVKTAEPIQKKAEKVESKPVDDYDDI